MTESIRSLSRLCFWAAALLWACVAFASQPPVTYDQIAKLTAPDGAANDQFGYSVAISGITIVVGKEQGAVQSAFVYENNSGTVTQVAELTLPTACPATASASPSRSAETSSSWGRATPTNPRATPARFTFSSSPRVAGRT